ncbi:MAG TPA: ribosome biogenesis GTPase YlqF [Peptococcaceae bacterium]|nr:ribosome biogenesis GTPase YlqF [Peptococcaceae bacterium]
MNIQWFPGHMTKAKRKLEEQLRWVDVVLELGDARLPLSSRNPLLQSLLGKKPKLLVLNKADLADSAKTEQWLLRLGTESPVIAVSAQTRAGINRIVPLLEKIMAPKVERLALKGVGGRPLRAMVVGIPNIGKSSLINQLTGGAQAKTGNKPGVTKGNQWIRIHSKVELLDTPGLLWPKFDDPEVGRKLAATGAIRDEVFDQEELANWLLGWLNLNYPQELQVHYGLAGGELNLENIGQKRGCLLSGGRIDTLKAAQIFLREFRNGKIAKVTMD